MPDNTTGSGGSEAARRERRRGAWYREPLLHFLAAGFAIFLLYDRVAPHKAVAGNRLVVSSATVAALAGRFQSAWQRPPTPAELNGLVDSYVDEEVLFRQGLALGLDRDDPVIRRRVLQKLAVVGEESEATPAPTDADLTAYLVAHADRYAAPARVAFVQVVFDPQRHREHLDADILAAKARLAAGAAPEGIGDPTMLSHRNREQGIDVTGRDYGEEFAAALGALPVGSWEGPLRSGYGLHLVRVTTSTPGRPATLAEVRAGVTRDWENDRRVSALALYTKKLRSTYAITVEPLAAPNGPR